MTPVLPSRRRALRIPGALAVACAAFALACEDSTGPPDGLRFGQLGQVVVEVVTPRLQDSGQARGEMRQTLVWRSSGEWRLSESLSYRGVLGDRHDTASAGDPAQLVGSYATWITYVNETAGIQLVGFDELSEDLEPDCGAFRTRVTVAISDEVHDTTRSWTRCAESSLDNLHPRGSGPDPAAGRVVEAARILRDFTVNQSGGFRSAYAGSLPFATLVRGEDLEVEPPGAGVIRDRKAFEAFWEAVSPDGASPLQVDFDEEVVLVAAVDSLRYEAGDSVEVRRVLPVQVGARVEYVERVAGDFCSPATFVHRPFHVVVAPAIPSPVTFTALIPERVPCPR